jgi:hypothetical protein
MSDILVKAIRVRVQSLANSLVVRNPDHFFMHPVADYFGAGPHRVLNLA